MRPVCYRPCVEPVESRMMASGDLLLAMGCTPAPQEILDAPPKTTPPAPGESPIGTPDVPDPTEILINPFQFPPLSSTTMSTAPYTVAIAVPVYYNNGQAFA